MVSTFKIFYDMIQIEACILRKNLQSLQLNANTIILSIFHLVKNKFTNTSSNLLQFAT